MTDIKPGDYVVAIRNGGQDRNGWPYDRPRKGKVYRVTGFYNEFYGVGCTLQNMDPGPYKGYLFIAHGRRYFAPLIENKRDTDALKKLIKSFKRENRHA